MAFRLSNNNGNITYSLDLIHGCAYNDFTGAIGLTNVLKTVQVIRQVDI